MNKKLLFAVAAAMTLGLGGVASADTISINGEDNFTSTTVNFLPNGPDSGSATGNGSLAVFTCTGCVDLTSATLDLSFSGMVFSETESTNTLTFELSNPTFSENGQTLTVTGSGELLLNGAPLSPASFLLTTSDPTGSYTFEAIITETPLPSTWMMLIASLLGLGLFAYRGSKKQSHGVSILAA